MRNFTLTPASGFLLSLAFLACDSGTGSDLPLPGAPTTVIAIPGNRQATVYWVPAEKGYSPASSYTAVVVGDEDLSCTIIETSYCTVKGLTNGHAYRFRVTATNETGEGPASAASAPVTPLASLDGIPDQPQNVKAKAGNTEAVVFWSVPESDGGSPITGYTVVAVQDAKKSCETESAYDTSCVVTGLKNGKAYTFMVTADNLVGTSVPSSPSASVTPVAAAPDAPDRVEVEGGAALVRVSWSTPYAGGASITGYKAVAVQDASRNCTTTDTSCVITGLTNETSYTFKVTATSAFGTSVSSAASRLVTPSLLPGVNWRAQISGTTGNLYGVTWANNQFVAVGGGYNSSFYGIIMTSSDGVAWTPRTSGATDYLYSVVWSGSQYVAVGGGLQGSVIVTSPDAVVWTKRKGASSGSLRSVVWTGTQFVAVGANFSGSNPVPLVMTSPDGITWTSRSAGVGIEYLGSLVWTGTQLVVAGRGTSGGVILTSSDGTTWTPRLQGPSLSAVGWSGTSLVAGVSDDTVWTSADGLAWIPRRVDISGFTNIIWSGSQWVSCGGNYIQTSPDAVTWKEQVFGDPEFSWVGISATASNGSRLVAVGDYGTILVSP